MNHGRLTHVKLGELLGSSFVGFIEKCEANRIQKNVRKIFDLLRKAYF